MNTANSDDISMQKWEEYNSALWNNDNVKSFNHPINNTDNRLCMKELELPLNNV